MERGAWQATVHSAARIGHDWATNTFTFWALVRLSLYYVYIMLCYFLERKVSLSKSVGLFQVPYDVQGSLLITAFQQTPWSSHITGEWGQPGVSEHLEFWQKEKETPWMDRPDFSLRSACLTWGQSFAFSDPLRSFICKRMVIGWLSGLNQCMISATIRSPALVSLWSNIPATAGRFLCQSPW